jgi:hypothetical protein
MKDEKPIPEELTWTVAGANPNAKPPDPPGKQMRIKDTGPAGVMYEYYVWGTVNGVDTRTDDPRIHNSV